MKKLKIYLNRIYRLSLSRQKREETVWKDLKRFHSAIGWNSGTYENDKYIRSVFEINEGKHVEYLHLIYDGCFHCKAKIIKDFPIELTTDIFLLATHFNNLFINGVVKIHVDNQFVEFCEKKDLVIPLLYRSEIYYQIIRHFNTSKDIFWAFHRLIEEQEAPAIIIADLLKKIKNEDETE